MQDSVLVLINSVVVKSIFILFMEFLLLFSYLIFLIRKILLNMFDLVSK